MEELQNYYIQGKELEKSFPLAAGLASLRSNSIKMLEEATIPNRKIENWKYTNLTKDLSSKYSAKNQDKKSITPSNHPDFINIYFLNGTLQEDISELSGQDFFIRKLDTNSSSEVEALIDNKSYFHNDFANLLNKANLSTGNIITLKKNSTLDKPVLIHQVYAGELSLHTVNNVYIIESNSKIEILENIVSCENVFLNISTNILVKENSKFSHHFIQDTAYGSLVLKQLSSNIEKNANYENSIFHTGAKTSRTNLYIGLTQEGANCDAHGLYALHRDQHQDTMSYIHHLAPHTESRQLYKGIMDDESRGVFTGRVRVEKDSQLVNAEQLNKNLLLTKKAHANSRPQLEIYADDVKCAHGSTTGQLSEDELFYFETRCVSKEKARQIMARAFAYDVVLKITNLKVRDFIKNHLIEKHVVS